MRLPPARRMRTIFPRNEWNGAVAPPGGWPARRRFVRANFLPVAPPRARGQDGTVARTYRPRFLAPAREGKEQQRDARHNPPSAPPRATGQGRPRRMGRAPRLRAPAREGARRFSIGLIPLASVAPRATGGKRSHVRSPRHRRQSRPSRVVAPPHDGDDERSTGRERRSEAATTSAAPPSRARAVARPARRKSGGANRAHRNVRRPLVRRGVRIGDGNGRAGCDDRR